VVQKLIFQSQKLLNKKNSSILSAAAIIAVSFLGSALLGLIRNRLLASHFFGGQEGILDVYFAAFVIPDTIFQLLVVGAISASFIPVYQEYFEKSQAESNWLARSVLSLVCIAIVIASTIISIFAIPISSAITHFSPEKIYVMANLIRIMSLAQIIFAFSAVFTGVLQSQQRFLMPAIAPLLYNLGTIFGVLLLSSRFGIYSAAIGVVIGATLHALVQLPSVISLGFKPKLIVHNFHPGVFQIIRLMPGRTFSLGLDQVQRWIAVNLTSLLVPGSLSIFTFARQLYILPISLFGVSLSQATFPVLSKDALLEDKTQFKNTLAKSIQIFFFALPASILVLVLRVPLVRIAFGTKSFPWDATLDTGRSLALLSLSIAPLAVSHTLTRALHALKDTKTPLLSGLLSVTIYTFFAFLFSRFYGWGITGLCLALSLGNFLDFTLIYYFLVKKVGQLSIWFKLFRLLFVTILTGFSLWLPMRLLDQFVFDTTKTLPLVALTLIVTTVGFSVYLVFCWIFKIEELSEFLVIVHKLGNWRKILASSDEVLETTSSNT
jgi:putative peptidoglycan lipid II flippase